MKMCVPNRASMAFAVLLVALTASSVTAQDTISVSSPDGRNKVGVATYQGRLYYIVSRDSRSILMPSMLGFQFKGAARLRDSLRITGQARKSHDETWTQPWGEVARVRDHHNELRISVLETTAPGRRFDVAFRVFNDGVGFRYEFPAQPALGQFVITDELTEFNMATTRARGGFPRTARNSTVGDVVRISPVKRRRQHPDPFTLETRDGKTAIVIHEANLVDYARMNLAGARMENRTVRVALASLAGGDKVRGRTPFVTPWRTIQLADRVADLSPSVLGLNLNPPNVLTDVSWIKPMKYIGIWGAMPSIR